MIVKILILALLVWLGYKIYLASKKIIDNAPSKSIAQDIVKCEKCGVHIPISDALKNDDMYYCSKEHLPKSD
jgi:uncharacterized protein